VAQGYDDQPAHRQAFGDAIATLRRRKDQLARRQQERKRRGETLPDFR
jgi:transposase